MKTYTIKTELTLEDAEKAIHDGGISLGLNGDKKSAKALIGMSLSDIQDTKIIPETATLRDQFAMAALQGAMASISEVDSDWRQGAVSEAYWLADEMIAFRGQKGKAQS